MSRWQREFEQHPFQERWKALVAEAPALTVDDETVITTVEEVARFKRAIAYLQTTIDGMDLELVPKSIWDSFNQQCTPCVEQMRNYAATRSLNYLQTANQHVDNLLTYVRPYLVFPEHTLALVGAAANSYRATLDEYLKAFLYKADLIAAEMKQHRDNSVGYLGTLEANSSRVNQLVIELIDGTPTQQSVQNSVLDFREKIERQTGEIDELFNHLLLDDGKLPSVATQVKAAALAVTEAQKEAINLVAAVKPQTTDLAIFHQKIFGGTVDNDGRPEEGLEAELNQRTQQLGELEKEQIQKYDALVAKIESLLPGATSAGLARAYQELRRSFAKPIRANTQLFYWSVGLMPVVALISSVHSFQLNPLSLQFIDYPNIESIVKAIFVKLPFIAPLAWLALFASMRRSQYERLQQEYAHKEALAKSYESYKKQLAALLSKDAEPLQKELIQRAIEAIAFNASVTLDGKHQEKMPFEHAMDLLASDKGQSFIERLRKLWP